MRVMALDIGGTRVGIAISDPQGRIATPLKVLPAKEILEGSQNFRRILEDWEPETLVIGMPYTLDGKEGPQAQTIRKMAAQISQSTGISYVFTDERLSSIEAKRSLREEGYSEREMRGKIDMIAASIFLQAWLDMRHR